MHDRSPEAQALRRLAVIVREVLRQHPEETKGEITDLVKDRLAQLHLPWEPWQLHHVLDRIDRRPYHRPPITTPGSTPSTRTTRWKDPPRERGPSRWTRLSDLMTIEPDASRSTTRG